MKQNFAAERTLRGALLGGVALSLVATVAVAQQTPPVASAPAPIGVEEIVVTGSRIASPNVLSAVPVTSLKAEDLTIQGSVSLGDALNSLPALRSTFSQANSTRFIGTAGLNTLDLRGQGTARTLVLVNGRRHITAQAGQFTVDTNTIPTDLLERVDVVTGGNSAVYGSDAVAGVVNFVTKRNFEGVEARAQGGISGRGDRESYFASVTAGHNFANDKGNVAASVEYAKSHTLLNTDRDRQTGAFSGRNQFNAVENTIGEPSTGNGNPDNLFFTGIRNNTISEGGLFTAACPALPAPTAANFLEVQTRRGVACAGIRNNTGQEVGRTFVFTPEGNLIANPIVTDFRPFGSGNAIGGLGSTLRLTGMLQPGLERKSVNVLSSYEVSPAFRPFFEAKYVRVDANQEGQPTFHNNTFNIDNPYLSAQARSQLQAVLAPGTTTFTAQRFNVDFGGRGEDHTRETYRVVAGVDGEFNDDWKYEVALNYGRLESFYETAGNIIVNRFNNSRDAVRAANGNIVCRVNADAITTNDDPACVPVNLFGNGAVSREALNYFGTTSSRDEKAEQFIASGYVSGDSSDLFELPAGPLAFALGGEFRRETASSVYDPLSASGATFLNAFAPFDPPAQEVTEGFAELRIPILADLPFADEFSIEASGRVSDYGGETGTVAAYNIGGVYAPVDDLRIRVGYARSVRAPTLTNLYQAEAQTFLNGLIDPCSQSNINNNPNRRANCAAAGVPTTEVVNGQTIPWTNVPGSGISGVSAGNPNLSEERGTSFTAGFVATPDFIDGLTVSIDYYSIEIDDVINTLGAQVIINQCYDNPSGISNPFCAAIFRRPDGTFAGQSNRQVGGTTVSFPVIGPSFRQGPFNFARQETSGVDADVTYRTTLPADITAEFRTIVSYLIKRDEFRDIVQPNFRTQLKGAFGDPVWSGQFSSTFEFAGFDLDYDLRYVGRQAIAPWEEQHSVDGRPATNPDRFPQKYYPDAWIHDIRVGYTFENDLRVYAGVDNLLDNLPPLDLLGTEGGSTWDNVGRFFYAGVSYKF